MSCGFLNPKNSIKFHCLCLLQSPILLHTALAVFTKGHLTIFWKNTNRQLEFTGMFNTLNYLGQ